MVIAETAVGLRCDYQHVFLSERIRYCEVCKCISCIYKSFD